MGRERRVTGSGLRFHVMGHAVAGEALFRDDIDRWAFIRRAARVLEEEDGVVEAHAEMPTHFHLDLLTRSTSISSIMQRLEYGYSHDYNLRHGRRGHLSRNRFLSKVISTADYRLTALLYIHCNPLKAGIVRSLDQLREYPFTGHAALMGNGLPWIQDLSVLKLFGRSIQEARQELERQMAAAFDRIPDDEEAWFTDEVEVARGDVEERAAEDSRIVLLDSTGRELGRQGEATKLRLEWPLEELVRRIAHRLGALKSDVLAGRRTRQTSEARAVICHLATRVLGYAPSTVAVALNATPAMVSAASRRGRTLLESDRGAFPEFVNPAKKHGVR